MQINAKYSEKLLEINTHTYLIIGELWPKK